MSAVTARGGLLLAALLAASAAGPAGAEAQGRMRSSEAQLLRESAALESRGDYDAAEAVLRRLLGENPASTGGLFALERVLRAQGDIV